MRTELSPQILREYMYRNNQFRGNSFAKRGLQAGRDFGPQDFRYGGIVSQGGFGKNYAKRICRLIPADNIRFAR